MNNYVTLINNPDSRRSSTTSSSSSSSSASISDLAHSITEMTRYTTLYSSLLQEYESTYNKLQDRHESLKKFKATSDDGSSLPRSMRIAILNKVNIPQYETNPDIFKSFIEDMKKLEIETNKKLFTIVIKQKECEINHLQQSLLHDSFISKSVDKIKQKLNEDASVIKNKTTSIASIHSSSSSSSSSSIWPIDEIVKYFQNNLKSDLNSIDRKLEEETLKREDERKKKTLEDITMQNQVNQQPAAQTMGKIMQTKTNEAIAPLHSKLQQYESNQKRLSQHINILSQQIKPSSSSSSSQHNSKKRKASNPYKLEFGSAYNTIEEAEEALGIDLQSSLNQDGGDRNMTKKSRNKSKYIAHR